jgi:hypothetical protein
MIVAGLLSGLLWWLVVIQPSGQTQPFGFNNEEDCRRTFAALHQLYTEINAQNAAAGVTARFRVGECQPMQSLGR